MEAESVELSHGERRVATAGVIMFVVGEIVLRVVGNTTNAWSPSVVLLGAFVAFAVGFAMYLAKSRSRSLGSMLAMALPDRLRRHPE